MKRHVGAMVWLMTTILAAYAGQAAAQCCGDCNGDNQVTVDEIVTAIARALTRCSSDGACDASVESCNTNLFNLQITLDATREDLVRARENLSACLAAPRVLASGQTTAYGPGSDGDLRPGAVLSYTDNGDGTITDHNTNLMWEKKDDSDGIHDRDNTYTWSGPSVGESNIMDGTISTTFLAALNAGEGFAGHTDWRIPSIRELQGIVDYADTSPAVDAAFHQEGGCAGCLDLTVPACSCTASDSYWSSTSFAAIPMGAWFVFFGGGHADFGAKSNAFPVRAVRGGL